MKSKSDINNIISNSNNNNTYNNINNNNNCNNTNNNYNIYNTNNNNINNINNNINPNNNNNININNTNNINNNNINISSFLPKDLLYDLELSNDEPKKNDYKKINIPEKKELSSQLVPQINIFQINNIFDISAQLKRNSMECSTQYIDKFNQENFDRKNYTKTINTTNIIKSNNNNNNNNNNYFSLKTFLKDNQNSLINIIMSYSGSHYLQKNIINYLTNDDINFLLNIISNNLIEILCNSYGNYFMQKIIQKSDKNQRLFILNKIKGNFINICKDNCGNHCVQMIIENINSKEEEKIIKFYIKKNLMELSLNSNSTYIIQKLIIKIYEKGRNYLIKFITFNFINLSFNINGASICKKFILETKNDQIICLILNQIENNIIKMCKDQYSNYVVQFAFENYGYKLCYKIINIILNNFLNLSVNKYSSNVIDKVVVMLKQNNFNNYFQLLQFVFFDIDNFNILNKNKYGQYVMINLFKICPIQCKNFIILFFNNNNNFSKFSKIFNYNK